MLLDHQAMPRVCVPGVVVVEVVDVDLELATVHVDVGDEQKRYVGNAIHTTDVREHAHEHLYFI